ncbi:MAG: nitrite reductase, partial [Actinomycetota bacterium]|nr:nitrite reductase [Actinomycetota bacterium]
MSAPLQVRRRPDRCPGVLRPWPADDGALVRIRLVGGRLPSAALAELAAVADRFGDGNVHLTGRANLQLRALPTSGGALSADVVDAIEATGLLPSRSHELARNVMMSPQTGLAGGRADLRPVAAELDRLLCAEPRLARLPGRFLFTLDDGRGDLAGRDTDLGLVAVNGDSAQLRIGSAGWGPIVPLAAAAEAMVSTAGEFLDVRGDGDHAAWHVDELPAPWGPFVERDPRTRVGSPALPTA